jgi:signal transduction histidine kinase
VRFTVTDDERPSSLILTVTDDGAGLPANLQPGVGLVSMRERAEELGGTCGVMSTPARGTQVIATLPYATGRER